ncbi:MAG: hypothetical protein J6P81_00940 [Spirochaetales bacterium]|nr:hypothetical protein [Spirochaetales bacterium]
MKKAIIITMAIVLFSALMVACNIDATLGIYSEVAQSTPSSDVVLSRYLGYYNSKYYYLSDDGVYSLETGVATTKLIASDENQRVVGAFMEDASKIYVLVESKEKDNLGETTIKYSNDSGKNYSDLAEGNGIKGMLSNGFCWNDSRIYYMQGGELHEFNTNTSVKNEILSAFSSDSQTGDEYAFFSVNETELDGVVNRFYVLEYGKSAPVKNIKGDSTYYCGFQNIGSDFYLLYKDTSKNLSYVYKLGDDGPKEYVKLNFNLKFSKTQNATFYDAGYNKLVVKCSTYFDEVTLGDEPKVESVKNRYASNICTADITNFKLREGQTYIVGTVNSMMYSIDMGNPDNLPVAIK